MEKMFAYETPQNGLTFDWGGMWGFGGIMIAIILAIFMYFFREPNGDIKPIKMSGQPDSDATQQKAQA